MRGLDGRVVVDVPVMYPSGATAIVEIERNGDNYWVSDMGNAHIETEYAAAQMYFATVARKVAENYGVSFDGHAIFALWVPSQRLEAAIVCVANASNAACSEAIRQASEVKFKKQNEKIFQRVQSVFGSNIVSKSMEIQGRHAQWEAHNVVRFPNRKKAVFEHMTNHTTSVSTKFLMFTDIRSSNEEISLNAIVSKIDSLDEKAQMIADVANIVSITASDDDFRRYAGAA